MQKILTVYLPLDDPGFYLRAHPTKRFFIEGKTRFPYMVDTHTHTCYLTRINTTLKVKAICRKP